MEKISFTMARHFFPHSSPQATPHPIGNAKLRYPGAKTGQKRHFSKKKVRKTERMQKVVEPLCSLNLPLHVCVVKNVKTCKLVTNISMFMCPGISQGSGQLLATLG